MKVIRHIGSMAFVLGLFTAVFVGMPWYVMVSDDPVIPWWLRIAVFCLLGGILVVLLTLALEQRVHKASNELYKHVLTYEIVEETDKAVQLKITECLWAKIFRAAKASDIGYAAICYADYAWTSAFNPKMRFIRTKTLMQGNDCCNNRRILEG